MTKISTNLGKVATTPKGEYNDSIKYLKLDVVTYNGSSYVSLKESIGNLPTNTEYWQLLANKGEKGESGYTPIKGVDYFTPSDIASLNIPRDTGDLSNNAGFITKAVNDLTNYYLKNETYTKQEVNTLIGNIYQFHYEIVHQLPTTGENNILYLVPKETSETNDYYDEYVYSNGWERIGSTEIDLSGYQEKITSTNKLDASLVDDSLSNNKFVTTSEKTTWDNKANTSDIPTKTSDLVNDSDFTSQEIFYIENNSSTNPFIFDGKKKGLYKQLYSIGIFYYKISEETTTRVYNAYVDQIYLNNDFNYIEGTTTYQNIGKMTFIKSEEFTLVDNLTIYNGMINVNTTVIGKFIIPSPQTIAGVKTFSSIPKQSNTTAPTLDTQFTNKKYVDDSITSAITTTLNGSY